MLESEGFHFPIGIYWSYGFVSFGGAYGKSFVPFGSSEDENNITNFNPTPIRVNLEVGQMLDPIQEMGMGLDRLFIGSGFVG